MSFLVRPISMESNEIYQHTSSKWSKPQKLVFASLMAVLATILQSAGGYLPGIGFLISPFTTLPIIMVTIISIRFGGLTYILAGILLLLLEPSELFIYPFTTGILGVSLGLGFRLLHQYWKVLITSGCVLFLGICIPLYMLGFPVFGPGVGHSVNIYVIATIMLFSFVYTAIWIWITRVFLKRIKLII